MAMKPKKIISSRGESGVGAGPGRGASSGGNVIKKEVMLKKKAVAKPKTTVKVKSGGNIQPAGTKKTIASNPANVGRPQSTERIKYDVENMMSLISRGSKVKINTDPAKKGVFSPLKKKIASANTPANRAKAAAAARALKAANKNR
jgi:hypothetical protein